MKQRSSFIFWLLLAATFAVYTVVGTWVAAEPFPTPPYAVAAFDALTFSLLSLVCLWSMFRPTTTVWSRIGPVVAVLLVSLLVTAVVASPMSYWGQFVDFLPAYGLHVALLILALWGLQRTPYWQRRFQNLRAWRFSLADLLIVMTTVAVLAAAMRGSSFLGDSGWLVFAMIICTVTLVVASTILWSLSRHWIICLASVLAVALVLGSAFMVTSDAPVVAEIIGADLLIQAVVLSIWLGIGGILPTTRAAPVGEAQSTAP